MGFSFEFALFLGFTFPRPDICHPYNSQRDYKSPWTDVKHEAIFSDYLGEKEISHLSCRPGGAHRPPKKCMLLRPKVILFVIFFLHFSVQF